MYLADQLDTQIRSTAARPPFRWICSNACSVSQDGVQILVANSLAAYIDKLDLECKKFLFMHRLKALLQMSNGAVIAT